MKKIIEDKGSDNGPFSSHKKSTSSATGLPSKDHLSKGKSDLANHPKKRKYSEVEDLTQKTPLKYGSRRNLL